MEMRILRYEATDSPNPKELLGIAIRIPGIGVVHLYTQAEGEGFGRQGSSCRGIWILETQFFSWKIRYTGHRRLKLNKTWI